MAFPKEIMWLGGAPGSGKGTNTPFILRERGLTAKPIVVSDLLDTPEMRALKDRGQFVGDRQVIEALLRKLLKPEYQTGVVVDGFPRTKVQAEAVKLLHDQIMQLRAQYWGTPTGKRFRRPIFRITVLFVGEKTSVERQLGRGRAIVAHNEQVRRTGVGELIELRATDVDEALARNRYRTFTEQTFEALTSLEAHFHYHFVNADAPLAEVEKSINAEFQYQSSLELGQATYDIIHNIPLASEVTQHARQELVRRLDAYEHAAAPLFKAVAAFIEAEVVPVIVRHASVRPLRRQDHESPFSTTRRRSTWRSTPWPNAATTPCTKRCAPPSRAQSTARRARSSARTASSTASRSTSTRPSCGAGRDSPEAAAVSLRRPMS